MKLILIAINFTLLCLSLGSSAEAKWSFCAGQTEHEGVYCSNVRFSWISYFANQKCQNWANQEDLPLLATYTFNLKKSAFSKQREVCDSLPGKGKWQCFIIEDCGTTSSISPIDTRVFAPSGDTDLARDNCVKIAWESYKDALVNMNHGCKIAPDAVEIIF